MDDAANKKTLADMVRERMDALGLSQTEFADRMEMSQEWVSKVRSGEIKNPQNSTLKKMAEVLALDLAELYVAASIAKTLASARKIVRDLASDDDQMDDPEKMRRRAAAILKRLPAERVEFALQSLELIENSTQTRWS